MLKEMKRAGVSALARAGIDRFAVRLHTGDALVLAGNDRLAFHGVDRIYPGTSTVLAQGGRINLTLRRVTRPGIEVSSRAGDRGDSPA